MKKKVLSILIAIVLFSTALIGCAEGSAERTITQTDKDVQMEVQGRGQIVEPAYVVQNYLSRKAINEWLRRVDQPNKLWYVYVMADSGAFVGYYVSRTIPISYGVSLTNPNQTVDDPNGSFDAGSRVLPAPGLDGVFYTGVDQTAWYFFDAETDALIVTNMKVSFLDRPLDIEVPLLRIGVE